MTDPRVVVQRWLDAIEARDVDRIVKALAEDITLETEMARTPVSGRDTLRAMVADSLRAFESVRLEPRRIVAEGRYVAVLLTAVARFGEDLELLGQRLPTAGKELEMDAAAFVEVTTDGKIARVERVRDTLTLIRQLGLSPDQVRDLVEHFEEYARRRPRAA